MPYTPILATLVYVFDRAQRRVLLVHRNARTHDAHLGKYNGLGGKLEPREDVVSGARRELREESTLEASSLSLRGTVSWPGFGKGGEDWFGFLFLVEGWTGTAPEHNAEGTLHWMPLARLLQAASPDARERDAAALPLWEGDRYFLPLLFDDDPRSFHGVMPYEDGRPVSWHCARV